MQRKAIISAVLAMSMGLIAAPVLAQGPKGPSFEELDANNDGVLTQPELEAAGARRFATLDGDSDGFLTKEELLQQNRERAERRVERMISRLDTNEDGKLSVEEIEARPHRGRMFERADANDDGQITKEEFAEMRGKARKRSKPRHSDDG